MTIRPLAFVLAAVCVRGSTAPVEAGGPREPTSVQPRPRRRARGNSGRTRRCAFRGELFEQKEYSEAAAMLERVLDRFPHRVEANTNNLAVLRLLMGDAGRAVAALEDGLRHGGFDSRWDPEGDTVSPRTQHPRFAVLSRRTWTAWPRPTGGL